MKLHRLPWLFLFLLGIAIAGCSSDDDPDRAEDELSATIRAEYGDQLFALDAHPPYPPDNHPSNAGFAARLDLGKLLFYDPVLSGNDDVSCGHCHHPAFAWGDGRPRSIGVGGVGLGLDRVRTVPFGEDDMEEFEFTTPRNSPTVLDNGFYLPFPGGQPWEGRMFWDGREFSLEKQARAPVRSRDEMKHDAYGAPDAVTKVCDQLLTIPEYVQRFKDAFPDELKQLTDLGYPETAVVNGNTYARAVAAYERELYTADSPFDRFVRGDDAALTVSQKRGLITFFEIGCDDCHGGMMFSDFDFYALGVKQGGPGRPPIHEHGDGSDLGRYLSTTRDQDRYAFRTPTLRNLSLTAPYFHTGGEGAYAPGTGEQDYQTLRQVMEFFNRGGNDEGIDEAYLHPYMTPLGLSDAEIDDVVAFLESLTGTRIGSNRITIDVPLTVPSGLDPPENLPAVITN